MTKQNRFELLVPLRVQKSLDQKQKDYTAGEDGSLTITGIASTTNDDLEYDVISQDAIKSMKEQATSLNLHADHGWNMDDVIGTIIEVLDTDDDTLAIKAKILPEYATKVKEKLDFGISLGLSIGGSVLDYEEQIHGWLIKDMKLIEISLTPLPANWDTMGTVTTSKGLVKSSCLSGACYTVVKNLNKNNKEANNMPLENEDKEEIIKSITAGVVKAMDDSESETTDTGVTEDRVVELINAAISDNEESMAQNIMDQIESKVSDMIDEKIAKEQEDEDGKGGDEGSTSDGSTETTDTEEDKSCGDGTSTDTTNEEDKACGDGEDKEQKSVSLENVQDMILNTLSSDEFQQSLVDKMWDNKNAFRAPESSAMKALREMQKTGESTKDNPEENIKPGEVNTNKTYSVDDAARALAAKNTLTIR